jgi:hypothetical protein
MRSRPTLHRQASTPWSADTPGWRYFDTEPILALFSRAGFTRLTVISLEEVHRTAVHPPSDQPSYAVVGFAD